MKISNATIPMEKTKALILKILSSYGKGSITSILKLCYLIDLSAKRSLGKQITDFTYIRYFYGPFTKEIYKQIEELIAQKEVYSEEEFDGIGESKELFRIKENIDTEKFDLFSDDEKSLVNKLLDAFKGYGARGLTEIAYETGPLKALGATLGGNENLYKKLDLK